MLIAGIGGFVGTCCRYLLCRCATNWISVSWAHTFPLGTFLVNIIGCFLIGIIVGVAEKYDGLNPHLSILLVTGFCGGFTTFSSMSNDMYGLIQNRELFLFSLYLTLSIITGLIMVWLGRSIIK